MKMFILDSAPMVEVNISSAGDIAGAGYTGHVQEDNTSTERCLLAGAQLTQLLPVQEGERSQLLPVQLLHQPPHKTGKQRTKHSRGGSSFQMRSGQQFCINYGHEMDHVGVKTYTYKVCAKTFIRNYHLVCHMKVVHGGSSERTAEDMAATGYVQEDNTSTESEMIADGYLPAIGLS